MMQPRRTSSPSGLTIKLGATTDQGLVREENQDAYVIHDGGPSGLISVLDGLGGHLGGREASHIAARVLDEGWDRGSKLDLLPRVSRSVRAAHEAVRQLGRKKAYRGCGTTLVAIGFVAERFILANVGDSRVYRLRQDAVDQITSDHTFANELIQQRLATPEAAAVHPDAETLTRCLGMESRIEIDLSEGSFEPGDRYLLCSDGLYRHVSDIEMGQCLLQTPDVLTACSMLTDLANARGGEDNITIGVLSVD